VKQPGLRIVPASTNLVLSGSLIINAQMPGKVLIRDLYQVEIQIPSKFPQQIPLVFETGGSIPQAYHHLDGGSLCLGSETRLRLLLAEGISLIGFVERCVVPYLYRFSYLKMYGEAPFEDLAHGPDGIREDLRLLFGIDRESAVLPFVRLVAMKKRHANKRACPCDSGLRLGRCHNRVVNRLRERLGRYWFRVLEQQLQGVLPARRFHGLEFKNSSVSGRENALVSFVRNANWSGMQEVFGGIPKQLSSPLSVTADAERDPLVV
jgi:hypothetical protein